MVSLQRTARVKLPLLLLQLLLLSGLTVPMEDTCQRVTCGQQGWECRNLRVCDADGACDIAVPTCIYKDTSRYRVPNICPKGGHPVVDITGKELMCGGARDCPLGFGCTGGVCCPGLMADVALPICQSLVKPNYNLPLFSTLEVCANRCAGDEDCEEDQVCCFRSCGSKCVRIDPKAEARTAPVIVTAASLSLSQTQEATSTSSSPPQPDSAVSRAGEGQTNGDLQSQSETDGEGRRTGDTLSPPDQLGPDLTQNGGAQYTDDGETVSLESQQQEPGVAGAADAERVASPFKRQKISEWTGRPVVTALVSRPAKDNSRRGPIPARSIRVNAPDLSNKLHNPAGDRPQKPGVCPVKPSVVICGQRPCDRDSLCPGPTKCCRTRCGQVCVTPQVSAGAGLGDRVGRLQGKLFRDIGANSRPGSPATGPRSGRSNQFSNPTSPGVFGRTLRDYGVDFTAQNSRPGAASKNPAFLNFQNVGETGEESGFYNPREGPLLQYGFRSPRADIRLASSRSAADSEGRARGQAEKNENSLNRINTTSSFSSESESELRKGGRGALSSDGSRARVAGERKPAVSGEGGDRRESDTSGDIISTAVNTAFRLNPPPPAPNSARRGVAKTRPPGGLLGGYALDFPDSPASFPGYSSRSGVGIDSPVAGIGFGPRESSRSPFGGFPGYGPSGFFGSARDGGGTRGAI